MRHTKDQKINGKPIVQFPPKTIRTILIKLSPDEKKYYDALEADVMREVRAIIRSAGRHINTR